MLALTACTTGDSTPPDAGPPRDLAATPASLPPEPAASATPSRPGATVRPGGPTPTGAGASATASTRPATTAAAPPGSATASPPPGNGAAYRPVAAAGDRSGDAGPGTPPYADVVAVSVEDDGTNARVTVRFAGDVPARLPENEVSGVGVDFFRSTTQLESDYQLFADGQPDGWYAYLQTPDGFVKYPGTFGVGGSRLVFTVPWSALGAPRSGAFSAFADWTRSATTNLAGEDHAPDLGSAPFSR